MLEQCLESFRKKTSYDCYEWIVVDNGSNEENRGRLMKLQKEYGFLYLYEEMPHRHIFRPGPCQMKPFLQFLLQALLRLNKLLLPGPAGYDLFPRLIPWGRERCARA